MLYRKIEKRIRNFLQKDRKALLITGARQVGKTYIVREIGKADFESFIEFNFLENETARASIENAKNSADVFRDCNLPFRHDACIIHERSIGHFIHLLGKCRKVGNPDFLASL